ncbi:peptidase [Alteromonas sp. KS69]|jgi:C-terminal processing protease CtpA/Prc|uniref:S41 family peptidase n=1 Tax=Alteromonas sp. KS69 TaxID=2109917 RepID=UPI000C484200|nr:S41 family peptidase [Alteromonas sp. KS69]MBB66535.1 peptidase [Rickettsiales bacterium]RUP75927.1 peptidase [Alteromonas sp. KS69]|tara:strand:+ start:1735 stop:3411 length:1677 start_codon:yes stop_codon:yes gene_type:complete
MLINARKCTGVALAVTVVILSGCGGGSGGGNTTTPVTTTPPVSNEPTWDPGVYESQSTFIAQCESPRTGIDPFTGSAYPDSQGSALDEKLWLRSWTNDTYLWYDEVDDNDPENFSVIAYFDQLKTNELTPSGTAKDNFHFSQDTAEYNELSQSGVSSGYGFDWEFVANTSPRELVVRFTEPDSPAALANVPRGASLITVNGIDFVNDNTQAGVDALNAALFPESAGTITNFEFELIDGSSLAVDITSSDVSVTPVQNVSVLDTENGKTGYFQFNTFIRTAQDGLIDAFDLFVDENVTELVIDLRYNGGGLLALASQVSYMVAGPSQTNNAIFETTRFNDKSGTTNPVTGGTVQATPFYSNEIDYNAGVLTSTLLPSLSLTRVYVITTGSTCSASEAVMNALRGVVVEVVQIGSTTCGKPYGFYPTDNCGETYFTIQFQGVNNKGFGDYADGFMPVASPSFDFELPGCDVEDDFTASLGDPEEAMLAAALEYSATGSCPVVASTEELTRANALGNQESAASTASNQTGEALLSIDNPNTRRNTFILHNKVNEPVIEERE